MTQHREVPVTLAGRLQQAINDADLSIDGFARLVSAKKQTRRESEREFETTRRAVYRYLGGGRPRGKRAELRLRRWARLLRYAPDYFTSAAVPERQQVETLEVAMAELQARLARLSGDVDRAAAETAEALLALERKVERDIARIERRLPPEVARGQEDRG